MRTVGRRVHPLLLNMRDVSVARKCILNSREGAELTTRVLQVKLNQQECLCTELCGFPCLRFAHIDPL